MHFTHWNKDTNEIFEIFRHEGANNISILVGKGSDVERMDFSLEDAESVTRALENFIEDLEEEFRQNVGEEP